MSIRLNHMTLYKKTRKFFILFMISFLLCGCWDYKDIDRKSMVLSLGIDYDNIYNNYIYLGEIVNFSSSSRQQTEQNKSISIYNFSSHGRTLEDAKLMAETLTPKPIFLGATKVVVFGKTIAEKSIEPYLNRIDGLLDYRKTLLAVVSKESPSQLFKLKVNDDISVGSSIQSNLEWLKSSSKALYTTIGEMISDISLGDVGYTLPYIGLQENDIQYLGLAVMKNSKLVDIIDVKDTDGLLYLLAEKPVLTEIMPGFKKSDNILDFETKVKTRKIKADYVDNIPVININLNINANLRYQYYIEPINEKEIKQLEKFISNKIEKDIRTIIKRSQKDFQCDIFGFVKYFKGDYPKIYKQIKWQDVYPTIKINVKVNTKITNLNLDDPNAKIKSSLGENNEK